MTLADLLRLCVQAVLAALVEEAARHIPRPPVPPPPTAPGQRATIRASVLASRLWDRYRDPANDACLTEHGRRMAVLYAAVLDDESVRWLAAQIRHEFADGPDQPPVSHEVFL